MGYGKLNRFKSLSDKRGKWPLHRAGLGSKVVEVVEESAPEPPIDVNKVEKKAKAATKKKSRKSKAKKSSVKNADIEE